MLIILRHPGFPQGTPLTRNIPGFLRQPAEALVGEVSIFTCLYYSKRIKLILCPQKCYTSLVYNLNIADVDCLKYALSKGENPFVQSFFCLLEVILCISYLRRSRSRNGHWRRNLESTSDRKDRLYHVDPRTVIVCLCEPTHAVCVPHSGQQVLISYALSLRRSWRPLPTGSPPPIQPGTSFPFRNTVKTPFSPFRISSSSPSSSSMVREVPYSRTPRV
jgi:hypothetical protein